MKRYSTRKRKQMGCLQENGQNWRSWSTNEPDSESVLQFACFLSDVKFSGKTKIKMKPLGNKG